MVNSKPNSLKDTFGMSKILRLSAAVGVAAAMTIGAGTALAAKNTYTFAGLKWGSSPKAAISKLKRQGFKRFRTAKGKRVEFVMRDAHGVFVRRNRGKRILARGKWSGERVTVEMIFGRNNKLQRVIVRTRNWNGTTKHAKRMTGLANTLTSQLENQFGPTAKKSQPFGFVDTATWAIASDGSRMQLYVRGTNGFMFYPRDKTGLRVHFSNPRFGGIADPAPRVVNVGKPSYSPRPVAPATPAKRAPAKPNNQNLWDAGNDR